MSISQNIETHHRNRIVAIKKMSKGIERDLAIGALVADLGKGVITSVASILGHCFRKIKKCYLLFINRSDFQQLSLEFRGRKKVEEKNLKIIDQIKEVIKGYEYTDPHFKTESLFVNLSLANLKQELINKYNYTHKSCPCRTTLLRILTDLGYKIQKVKKSKVLNKIPETDAIFENINETKKFFFESNDRTVVISIDDKNRKKIGNISDNGYSWFKKEALDHDTNFDCTIVPFGILDLKTNETFVYCNKYSSTASFKIDCIEDYLIKKKEKFNINRLIIFLDNGPENSSKRTLWIKCLIDLVKKHKISIELAYYPPYHSKYNMIERYWARLQLSWSGLIINTIDELINTINRVTWKGIKTQSYFIEKKYKKGITIDKEEMIKLENKHVYREESIEKWSLIITP